MSFKSSWKLKQRLNSKKSHDADKIKIQVKTWKSNPKLALGNQKVRFKGWIFLESCQNVLWDLTSEFIN